MNKRMTAAEAKFISRTVPPFNEDKVNKLIEEILELIEKQAQTGVRSLEFEGEGFHVDKTFYRQEQKLVIDELVSLGYVITYNHVQSPAGCLYDDYSITISWE